MSELSVIQYLHNDGSGLTWGYDKREADKVIALLTDKANYNEYAYKLKSKELADTCRFYEDELRHHKYHRCLDMAARCMSEEKRLDAIAPLFVNDKECWEYNSDYWNKWHKRWLEIATKFKEAK